MRARSDSDRAPGSEAPRGHSARANGPPPPGAASTHTTDTADHHRAEDEPDGSGRENETEAQVAAAGYSEEQVTGLVQVVQRTGGEAGSKHRRERESDVP